MRTVKEPDVRKQEILDGAVRVFAEKGYDKTTISILAKALGISQGLCYRYFASKEEIYYAAIEKYADLILEDDLHRQRQDLSIYEWIDSIGRTLGRLTAAEEKDPQLYALFHTAGNRAMHDLLLLRVAAKLLPHVQQVLRKAKEKGEIAIEDTDNIAVIGLYGELGLIFTEGLTEQERIAAISMGWKHLLKL